jgi:tetratricopeptide (TPR) repeat protein
MKISMQFQSLRIVVIAASLILAHDPLEGAAAQDIHSWDSLMLNASKALKGNKLDESIGYCDQALKLARSFGASDTHFSRSQVLRAEIYMWQKRNDLAEQSFKDAVASCEKAAGPSGQEMVYPLASLGNYYYYYDVHLDRVASLNERILDIVEHAPAPDDRDIVMWSRNLAIVYQQMGRNDQAERLYNEAVARAGKSLPDWLPHELLTTADFYKTWGKCEQAEAMASRALTIREKALAANDSVDARLDLVVTLDEMGAIDEAWGKLDRAESHFRRSLALAVTFMKADQADLLPRVSNLATVLADRKNYAEADLLLQRAEMIAKANFASDSPEVAAVVARRDALRVARVGLSPADRTAAMQPFQ